MRENHAYPRNGLIPLGLKGLGGQPSVEPWTGRTGKPCRSTSATTLPLTTRPGGIRAGARLRSVKGEKIWKSLPRGKICLCLGETLLSNCPMTRLERLRLWLASERPVTKLRPGQAFRTARCGRRLLLVRHEDAFSVARHEDGQEVQVHPDVLVSTMI